jgi:hypothetical protein
MSKKPMPPIADLIAQTPGAQSRDQANKSVKARRDRLLNSAALPAVEFETPEPLPEIDTEGYAKGFFERMMDREGPPPRGGKPRVVVDNDDPKLPPDKSKE